MSGLPNARRTGHLTQGKRSRGGLSCLQLPGGRSRAEGDFRPELRDTPPGLCIRRRAGAGGARCPPTKGLLLPVWVRTCLFRSNVSLKPFPQ